ncbi:MAG: hypothetical protein ACRDFB_07140, partial [Rhabdochlamydiaceae bacterium]
FKYNGRVKSSIDKFEGRKDKYSFHKFTRKFTDLNDFITFVSWCFITKEKVSVKTIMQNYKEYNETWIKWHKDRYVNFGKDILNILNDKTEKTIYELYLGEKIHLGSIFIIDFLYNSFEAWNTKKKGTYPWDTFYYKALKFKPFYERYEPINATLYSEITNKDFANRSIV